MSAESYATKYWDSILSWTTILSILGALVYIYFRHKFSYWSRLGLKSPPPVPWFGTGFWPLVTPKPLLELEHHRKYGKLYGLYDGFMGTNPTLVCGHPEVLKQVTIKNFESFTNRRRPSTWKSIRFRALTYMRDEEWRNMRKILAPTFTSNKLKKMFELMKRCTKNLEKSIELQAGQEVDLKKLFSVFTVDVISTCCFGMDLKDYRDPESPLLLSARKFFNVSRFKMATAILMPKSLLALSGFDINDTTSIEFFYRFATEIINKRRKLIEQQEKQQKSKDFAKQHFAKTKFDDFLQTLIDAAAEFNNSDDRNTLHLQPNAAETSAKPPGGRSLRPATNPPDVVADNQQDVIASERQEKVQVESDYDSVYEAATSCTEQQLGDLEILAQSMLFFAVGHETTATLLSSCGLFLALYPEMQERLYAEVAFAFNEDKQGEIGYDTLLNLQYLDAFVSEALRFYTPTLTFDREASEDVEIQVDGYKFTIPKGMGVVIPFHAIHHDPDNFAEPETFNPERFMPENRKNIKPCTFIPFGSGPRFCLASRFALVEAKLALANLVYKYKFVKSESTIWPPKFRHHYMLLQMEWPKIKFLDRKRPSGENNCAPQTAA